MVQAKGGQGTEEQESPGRVVQSHGWKAEGNGRKEQDHETEDEEASWTE